jgi:hypothetical protein
MPRCAQGLRRRHGWPTACMELRAKWASSTGSMRVVCSAAWPSPATTWAASGMRRAAMCCSITGSQISAGRTWRTRKGASSCCPIAASSWWCRANSSASSRWTRRTRTGLRPDATSSRPTAHQRGLRCAWLASERRPPASNWVHARARQAPIRTTVRPLTRPSMKSWNAPSSASNSIVRVTSAKRLGLRSVARRAHTRARVGKPM